MEENIINKLNCNVSLKDFLSKYAEELHKEDPEKYNKFVSDLSDTTKPLNIETQEQLDEYLSKIHHQIIDEKGLWDVSDTTKIARSIGIDFNQTWYNEFSFNYVMNMVRADNYEGIMMFCNEYPSTKQYILDSPKFYAYLAKSWLEDQDATKHKLMLYLKYIVDYS